MKQRLVWVFFLSWTGMIFAQNIALESEISFQNGLAYKDGQLYTGIVFSDDENIPNECDCTLEAHYKNGKLHGWLKKWYSNGNLKFKGKYVNGKPVGEHIYYYANGNMKKKEIYENGQLIRSILYNSDGTPKNRGHAPSSSAVKNDRSYDAPRPAQKSDKKTYDNRQQAAVSSTEVITSVSASPGNGYQLQTVTYPDGTPKRKSLFLNGIMVKDTLFGPNGMLQEVKKYDAGELVHYEKYDNEGRLQKEENYQNNKKHGIQTEYYPNGKIKSTEIYQAGFLEHKETFDPDGRLLSEENYKLGKKHGIQKIFDPNGQLKEKALYEYDQLVEREKILTDGKEIITTENGLQIIKRYDLQNRLVTSYSQDPLTGRLEGLNVQYDPETGYKRKEIMYKEGRKLYEGSFENDQRHGEWKYYMENEKGEEIVVYDHGKEISRKTIIYDKQLKNIVNSRDVVLYKMQYYPAAHPEYFVIRFPELNGKEFQYIQNAILGAFADNQFKPVKNITEIGNEQITALIRIDSIRAQLKQKNNKYLYLLSFQTRTEDLEHTPEIKKWVIVPQINPGGIEKNYQKTKTIAFEQTLSSTRQKLGRYLRNKYPLTVAARKKEGGSGSVWEVYLNAGQNAGIVPKDKFVNFFNTNGQNIKVEVSVQSVGPNFSSAGVNEGKKELSDLFRQQTRIKLIRQ